LARKLAERRRGKYPLQPFLDPTGYKPYDELQKKLNWVLGETSQSPKREKAQPKPSEKAQPGNGYQRTVFETNYPNSPFKTAAETNYCHDIGNKPATDYEFDDEIDERHMRYFNQDEEND
jgi:hypothetical protein